MIITNFIGSVISLTLKCTKSLLSDVKWLNQLIKFRYGIVITDNLQFLNKYFPLQLSKLGCRGWWRSNMYFLRIRT